MRVVAATKNAGKLRELHDIFAPFGWTIESDARYADPIEGDDSYEANAALKARALHAQLVAAGERTAVIGDDSGLEVKALGGRPGVRSARYGGEAASWPERRAQLLREVEESGDRDRSARFVCALHSIAPDGHEVSVMRAIDGRIAQKERGGGGFSYDALFEYPPGGQTFGEIREVEKNRLSHRALAARALVELWSARERSGSSTGNLE